MTFVLIQAKYLARSQPNYSFWGVVFQAAPALARTRREISQPLESIFTRRSFHRSQPGVLFYANEAGRIGSNWFWQPPRRWLLRGCIFTAICGGWAISGWFRRAHARIFITTGVLLHPGVAARLLHPLLCALYCCSGSVTMNKAVESVKFNLVWH